jgi:hypothetical protein
MPEIILLIIIPGKIPKLLTATGNNLFVVELSPI